jgi:hypothetical protein
MVNILLLQFVPVSCPKSIARTGSLGAILRPLMLSIIPKATFLKKPRAAVPGLPSEDGENEQAYFSAESN